MSYKHSFAVPCFSVMGDEHLHNFISKMIYPKFQLEALERQCISCAENVRNTICSQLSRRSNKV